MVRIRSAVKTVFYNIFRKKAVVDIFILDIFLLLKYWLDVVVTEFVAATYDSL